MGLINARINILFMIFLILLSLFACEKRELKNGKEIKKLSIVTSLFPLYDFTKEITRDKASIAMLLLPGVEPHSFEPKPADIISLNNADIFIYTNKYMEPWVADILKGVSNPNLLVIDSSRGIKLEPQRDLHLHEKKHAHANMDPHIWLDFSNTLVMIDNILHALVQKDPANAVFYRQNAENYKKRITELDDKYKKALSSCEKRIFISGGHFSFGYLANRYGLKYISAFESFSPDAEPSPKQIVKIIRTMKQHGLKHIFYEELITTRIAEAILGETGGSLLLLHAAHNISKDEFNRGETFISLMERNLTNLITGLQCQHQ